MALDKIQNIIDITSYFGRRSKMNICFFSIVTYWHGLRGGMDLQGKYLLEGLSESGHKIIVISTKHPSGKEYEETNGIKIYYLEHTTFSSPRRGWKRQSINKFKDIVKKEKIDAILSQSMAGFGVVKIAKNMGIPFVTIMHGYQTMVFLSILNHVMNSKKGYLYLIKSFLTSFYYSITQEFPILKNSSAIITVSNTVAEVIGKRPFIHKDKIKVVYPGIDLELFKISAVERVNIRKKHNISEHERVVLFLSFITKQKGVDVAIKAFSELPKDKNLKLIIVGKGEYLEEAKLLVRNFKLESSVIFTGFIRSEDRPKYYNASDIYIFPTFRLESFGIVIAEAMACGIPVIASKIGAIPSVIDEGINGLLIPPGDVPSLTEKMLFLLNNKDFADKLAKNGREKVIQKFSHENMVEETIKILEIAKLKVHA